MCFAESPQDLSCAKEENETQHQLKMDIDSDSDCESDGQSQSAATDTVTQQKQQQQQQLGDDSQQVRPQIIVTPRKVAAAITDSIASILAKNNKTTLSECVAAPSTMLFPSSFVFEVNSGASTSSGSVGAEGSVSSIMAQGGSSTSGSPSKSVIVRAGPSVSSIFVCISPFSFFFF